MFYGKPNAGLLCVGRFKSPLRFRVALSSELRMTVSATRNVQCTLMHFGHMYFSLPFEVKFLHFHNHHEVFKHWERPLMTSHVFWLFLTYLPTYVPFRPIWKKVPI